MEIEDKLDILAQEFNRTLKNNILSSESKIQLTDEYKKIMNEYLRKFSEALQDLKVSRTSFDFLESQFEVLNRKFAPVIEQHGEEDFLALRNFTNQEFEQNLETLHSSTTSESKKEDISNNSKTKNVKADSQHSDSVQKDILETEIFKDYLKEFSSDILLHTKRLDETRMDAHHISEEDFYYIKKYIDRLNDSTAKSFFANLNTHTKSIYDFFYEKNSEYLKNILEVTDLNQEKKYDPFAPVSPEVQENLKKVGNEFSVAMQDTEKTPDNQSNIRLDSLEDLFL